MRTVNMSSLIWWHKMLHNYRPLQIILHEEQVVIVRGLRGFKGDTSSTETEIVRVRPGIQVLFFLTPQYICSHHLINLLCFQAYNSFTINISACHFPRIDMSASTHSSSHKFEPSMPPILLNNSCLSHWNSSQNTHHLNKQHTWHNCHTTYDEDVQTYSNWLYFCM